MLYMTSFYYVDTNGFPVIRQRKLFIFCHSGFLKLMFRNEMHYNSTVVKIFERFAKAKLKYLYRRYFQIARRHKENCELA